MLIPFFCFILTQIRVKLRKLWRLQLLQSVQNDVNMQHVGTESNKQGSEILYSSLVFSLLALIFKNLITKGPRSKSPRSKRAPKVHLAFKNLKVLERK